MADIYVKDSSTWKKVPANGIYVKDSGAWVQADYAYMKVAGVWTLAYTSDFTGPAAPSSPTATWNGNALRVAWTNPADADFSHVLVYVTPSGYSTISAGSVSGTPSQAKTFDFTSFILDNVIYSVQLVPYDTNGNAGTPVAFSSMAWTGLARGRTPLVIAIDPTDSGTWRDGAWRTVDNNIKTVLQGSSSAGEHMGIYTYGTQFYDYLRGATVSSAAIELYRQNNAGYGGNRVAEMWTCTLQTRSGSPVGAYDNQYDSVAMSINGNNTPWSQTSLPSAWRTRMGSYGGSPRFGSVLFKEVDTTIMGLGVSNDYMKLYPDGSVPGTVVPGRIWINHSG